MHLSVIPNIVQQSLALPNTPAAYYAAGAVAGAVVCVIVWFVRDAWLRRTESSRPRAEESTVTPESEPGSDAEGDGAAAKRKKARKLSGRDLLYIAGIYIGTDLIAKGAKGIFPNIPADAVVWGALTGFVLCLMILIGLRNLSQNKTSSGQQA